MIMAFRVDERFKIKHTQKTEKYIIKIKTVEKISDVAYDREYRNKYVNVSIWDIFSVDDTLDHL